MAEERPERRKGFWVVSVRRYDWVIGFAAGVGIAVAEVVVVAASVVVSVVVAD